MKLVKILATFGVLGINLTASGTVQADNLVNNGDFSQGLTGWTLSGDAAMSSVDSNSDLSGDPSLTGNSFIASTYTSSASLLQTLNLVAGVSYDFKFDLNAAAPNYFSTGDFFKAQLGSTTLLNLTTPSDSTQLGSTPEEFLYTATGATLLDFSFMNLNNQFNLSNVSVTVVPLPQVWTLMLTGLVFVGAKMRAKNCLA
jgi:hypothetical protein